MDKLLFVMIFFLFILLGLTLIEVATIQRFETIDGPCYDNYNNLIKGVTCDVVIHCGIISRNLGWCNNEK